MTNILLDLDKPDQKSPESPSTSEAPPLIDSPPSNEISPTPPWRDQQQADLQARDHRIEFIAPTDIIVGNRMRSLNRDKLEALKEAIQTLSGIKTPLSVRPNSHGKHELVTGWHRLQAAIELGLLTVPVRIEAGCETDAQLWEISENLHRAELTELERNEHINRWRELTLEKVGKIPPPGGQQPDEKAYRKTARELRIDKKKVREAEKVANLDPEVKAVAEETGETSHTALLEAAKQPTKEEQIQSLRERHAKHVKQPDKPSQKPKTPGAPKPAPTSDDTRSRFLDSFETLLKREARAVLLDVISFVGNYPPVINAISEGIRKDLVRKFAERLDVRVIID